MTQFHVFLLLTDKVKLTEVKEEKVSAMQSSHEGQCDIKDIHYKSHLLCSPAKHFTRNNIVFHMSEFLFISFVLPLVSCEFCNKQNVKALKLLKIGDPSQ